MENSTEDPDYIAKQLKQRYSLRDLATKYHHVISAIYGEDIRSSDIDGAIRSQTNDFLAESVALVRGESAEQISLYLKRNKDELRDELKTAMEEYGIHQPKVTTNIGPTVPHLLAIAYIEYDSVESPLK